MDWFLCAEPCGDSHIVPMNPLRTLWVSWTQPLLTVKFMMKMCLNFFYQFQCGWCGYFLTHPMYRGCLASSSFLSEETVPGAVVDFIYGKKWIQEAPMSPSWTGLEFLIDMVGKDVYWRGRCRGCPSELSRSLTSCFFVFSSDMALANLDMVCALQLAFLR